MNQQKWDLLLMQGWDKEKSMLWVAWKYYGSNDISKNRSDRQDAIREMCRKIENEGLKRCTSKVSKNTATFNVNQPVRAFVSSFCKPLSDALWNGEPALVYALSLNNMKWDNDKFSSRQKARRTQLVGRRQKKASTKRIMSRSLSKNHDWNTVK